MALQFQAVSASAVWGGCVKKGVRRSIAIGVVLVAVGVLAYVYRAALVAWARFLFGTQDVNRLLFALTLVMVAALELIVSLILRQRALAFDQERADLSDLNRRQVELLQREADLLRAEKAEVEAELLVRDEMVRQERSMLLARLQHLKSSAGIPLAPTVTHLRPRLSSRDLSAIDRALSRLEQIELTLSAAASLPTKRRDVDAVQARDWLRLGTAYYYLGVYPKAITYFERALVVQPRNVDALIDHGFALLAQGNVPEALDSFDEAVRVDGASPAALHGRGVVYEALERDSRALEEYSKAIRLAPDWAEAYYARGVIYERLGQYDRAAEDLEQATTLRSDFSPAHLARGIVRTATRDYQWALRDLNMALSLDPRMSEAYYRRGVVYAALDEYEQAVTDLGRALELAPMDCQVLRERSSVQLSLEQFDGVLKDCSHVIELDGGDALIYDRRGLAYTELQEYRKALHDLTQAIELQPLFTKAYVHRSQVYEKQGHHAGGRNVLFLDTHVDWVTEERFQELIKKDNEYRRKKGFPVLPAQ